MLFSFLVTLREGVEIALILAITIGYLVRSVNERHVRAVSIGAAAAGALAIAFAGLLQLTRTELSGRPEEIFEGVTMLAAVAVLTWMVLWMRRQAATLGGELRRQVDAALASGSVTALVLLAFSAVIREGIETALFLFAGASAQAPGGNAAFVLGGVLGFAAAAVVGFIVYRGSHRLPLGAFFRVTGVMVLVLAAGLLSNGLHELQEAALIPELGPPLWSTEALLSAKSTLGTFLHTLLGYDPTPALGQVVAWAAYLVGGLYLILGGARAPRPGGPRSPGAVTA